MIYFIQRKIRQIKNLFKWIPIIWKQYDFDYRYAIDVFKFKLSTIADFLDSEKSYSLGAEDNASRIRMVIRLMDKIYDGEYGLEYQTKLKNIYGDDILDCEFIENDKGTFTIKYKYELTRTESEIIEINKMNIEIKYFS